MNVGVITRPNEKGQIVIPKEFRDNLGIDANVPLNLIMRGRGIYIYPIVEVVTAAEVESSYLDVLSRTNFWTQNSRFKDMIFCCAITFQTLIRRFVIYPRMLPLTVI